MWVVIHVEVLGQDQGTTLPTVEEHVGGDDRHTGTEEQ